jgi:hypothetical protein
MDRRRGKSSAESKMRPNKLTYRGHKVSWLDPGEPAMPMLSIGATKIMVRREETGGYSAPMLNMFGTYPTLEALARSLIDTSPVFLAQRKD